MEYYIRYLTGPSIAVQITATSIDRGPLALRGRGEGRDPAMPAPPLGCERV